MQQKNTHSSKVYRFTDAEGWTFFMSDKAPYMVIDQLEAQYDQHLTPNPPKGEKELAGVVEFREDDVVDFRPE